MPQPQRAKAGIGRSYQRTTIFPEFTVLNCRLTYSPGAAQTLAHLGIGPALHGQHVAGEICN